MRTTTMARRTLAGAVLLALTATSLSGCVIKRVEDDGKKSSHSPSKTEARDGAVETSKATPTRDDGKGSSDASRPEPDQNMSMAPDDETPSNAKDAGGVGASGPTRLTDAGLSLAGPSFPLTGKFEVGEEALQQYSVCAGKPFEIDNDLAADANEVLNSYPEGDADVALTPDGCVHFVRHVEDGVVTSSAFIHYMTVSVDTGGLEALDPSKLDPAELAAAASKIKYVAVYSTVARWDLDGDVMVGSIATDPNQNYEPDAFREIESKESDGHLELALRDGSADNVVWQQSADMTPDDGGGEFTTDAQFRTASGAAPTSCTKMGKPCSKEQQKRLDDDMRQAIDQGIKCLKDFKVDFASRMSDLASQWAKKHTWNCVSGCGYVMLSGFGAKNQTISVDFDKYVARPEARGAILFHEMLHATLPGHSRSLIEDLLNYSKESSTDYSTPRGQKLTTLDRTFACQALCFDEVQTRCSCASCLDVQECDDRCKDLPPCNAATCDVATGTCTREMSDGLTGCEKTDAKGKQTYAWYLSPTECQMSGCEMGSTPGKCRKFGRECMPEE